MIIALWIKKLFALCAGVTLFCAWKCAFVSHEGFDRSAGLDLVCAVKCLFYSAIQFIPMMLASEASIVGPTSVWDEMDMGAENHGEVDWQTDFSTWQGTVKTEKNLTSNSGPGFCSIKMSALATKNADHFVAGGILLKVRSSTPEYQGFNL